MDESTTTQSKKFLRLRFVETGEERIISRDYLEEFPNWSLVLALKETNEDPDVLLLKEDMMTLETYDEICKYLECGNFWKLSTSVLTFLKIQGIITSLAYHMATSSDSFPPSEKLFAWKVAQFELDSSLESIECKPGEYLKIWKYLKYNDKIVPYQTICIIDVSNNPSHVEYKILIINGCLLERYSSCRTVSKATSNPNTVRIYTEHLHPDTLDTKKCITCNFGNTASFGHIVDSLKYDIEIVTTSKSVNRDDFAGIPRRVREECISKLYLQCEKRGVYQNIQIHCGFVKLI